MTESTVHKQAKAKASGRSGAKEKAISGGRRLDAASRKKATEVERSGSKDSLIKAASRLRDSGRSQKVLQVPQPDMHKAAEAMRKVGISGTVKNMSGTKSQPVSKSRKKG
jgi:hypothetical protein